VTVEEPCFLGRWSRVLEQYLSEFLKKPTAFIDTVMSQFTDS